MFEPTRHSRAIALADGPDTARRYRHAIVAARPAVPAAGRRNRRCHRPGGKSYRSETSPRAARAAEYASPRKTNCRTRWSRNLRWPPPSQASSCAGRRFGYRSPPHRPTRHFACHSAEAIGDEFHRAEMHGLAQGIAHLQKTNDLVGESLDHGDLKPEPKILDLGAERFALVQQNLGPRRHRVQALQQRHRRPFKSERLDGGPRCRQRIARKINAIEFPVVFATVLKMIVDLQAGAERVRGRPGRRALAVDVEH